MSVISEYYLKPLLDTSMTLNNKTVLAFHQMFCSFSFNLFRHLLKRTFARLSFYPLKLVLHDNSCVITSSESFQVPGSIHYLYISLKLILK